VKALDELVESAMTTKRSAVTATNFSRVCAPPPPFTSIHRERSGRSVDSDVQTVDPGERLDEKTERAGGFSGSLRRRHTPQRKVATASAGRR